MKITRKSPLTGKIKEMEIDITPEQLFNWQSGTMIQHAMPNITPDEREFILSGYSPEDWEKMFPKDEEEYGNGI